MFTDVWGLKGDNSGASIPDNGTLSSPLSPGEDPSHSSECPFSSGFIDSMTRPIPRNEQIAKDVKEFGNAKPPVRKEPPLTPADNTSTKDISTKTAYIPKSKKQIAKIESSKIPDKFDISIDENFDQYKNSINNAVTGTSLIIYGIEESAKYKNIKPSYLIIVNKHVVNGFSAYMALERLRYAEKTGNIEAINKARVNLVVTGFGVFAKGPGTLFSAFWSLGGEGLIYDSYDYWEEIFWEINGKLDDPYFPMELYNIGQ